MKKLLEEFDLLLAQMKKLLEDINFLNGSILF